MPQGLQVYVVKNPTHVGAALKVLRASMRLSTYKWWRELRKNGVWGGKVTEHA